MRSRIRRRIAGAATLGLVGYVVVALIIGTATSSDRVDSISSRLRCPVCQGESVADSGSQTARDMRAIIEEQVEDGLTDDQIEAYFVARYSSWILLDPPASGRTLLLWVLPFAALGLGVFAILSRKRGEGPPASNSARMPLEELRTQALRDLEEVEGQHAAGELDEETANRLQALYKREANIAETRLASHHTPSGKPIKGRSRRRVMVGAAIVVLGIAAATVAAVNVAQPRREGGFVTGDFASDPGNGAGDTLEDVTNEQLEEVVAANPGVTPMRLALARRYFTAGDYAAALPHYELILETENDAEALAGIGWITHLSGDSEQASQYLQQSLAVDPDFVPAKWFLANVLVYGQQDPAAAVPLLRDVAASAAVPDGIRAGAERILAQEAAGTQ